MDTRESRELHNKIVKEAVKLIMQPMIEADADAPEVLVILESVVAGCLWSFVKVGGDEPVIDQFAKGVKERMAVLRREGLGGVTMN